MNTDLLIAILSDDVPRVSRHAVAKRIGAGLAIGGMIAMIAMTTILGIRPDLQVAMRGFSFWMKWTYTISLGLGAAYAVTRLARPDTQSLQALWILAVPVLLLAGICINELARDVARQELDGVPVARPFACGADLPRTAVVVPQNGADPVARRRCGRRTHGRRMGGDDLLPALPGSLGAVRSHLVQSWNCDCCRLGSVAGATPDALVTFCNQRSFLRVGLRPLGIITR